LFFSLLITQFSAHAENSSPTPHPSAEVAPTKKEMTRREKSVLKREYKRAQSLEVEALKHRQKFEGKEFEMLQAKARAAFSQNSEKERLDYFASHPKGAERRSFRKTQSEKKKQFQTTMRQEKKAYREKQKAEMKELKAKHKENKKRFDGYLKQGQNPAQELWPTPGA